MTQSVDNRVRELIVHAFANAPAFREIMRDVGLTPAAIQSVADLSLIPLMSKDRLTALQQRDPPFGGLLAVDPDSIQRIYVSPGPIYDPHHADFGLAEGTLAAFKAANFMPGDRALNTFMYHLTPAGLLLDETLRLLGCTVIPAGPGNTELQIKLAMALHVTGFVGTPSFLNTLLDKMEAMAIAVEAVPFKKAFFTAEPYTPAQRERFEGVYEMTTVSGYGTADLGLIAHTRAGVQGFCVVDSVYVEIVDPDTGAPMEAGTVGEIVVTTFNKTYPLIRFATGDLGALAPEPHEYCQSGQQLLGLFGRSGEAVKVRGMFLHPNQLRVAVSRVSQIKYAQAVVTRPEQTDVLTVLLELHPEHHDVDVAVAFRAHLEGVARLRVDDVRVVEPGVIDPEQRVVRDDRKWD